MSNTTTTDQILPAAAEPKVDTQCLPKADAALIRYREGVEELWKLKSSTSISNGEHAHAAVLFASFFNHAQKQVRIFCNSLGKDVFGSLEVVRAARAALNRGVGIDIIIQGEPEKSEFKEFLDSGEIRFIKNDPRVNSDAFKINFAVMDDMSLRVEPDYTKCEATAVMYDPKNAKVLSAYFDKLWEMLKVPPSSPTSESAA